MCPSSSVDFLLSINNYNLLLELFKLHLRYSHVFNDFAVDVQ